MSLDGYLQLDRDVALWLHVIADRDYNGNVELALNEAVRVVMTHSQNPSEPWRALERRQAGREAARRAARGQGGP